MSDLSDKALERQSAKNSDRIQKELDTERRESRIRNSVLKRYDPALGRWEVQEGGSTIPNCRPITNATLAAGMPVVRKGNLIDQRRNRKKVVVEEVAAVGKNIKYLLRKTVAGVTKLYVCGWKTACVEALTLPAGSTLLSYCLDNQGGDRFYLTISYRAGGAMNLAAYRETGLVRLYTEAGLDDAYIRPAIGEPQFLGGFGDGIAWQIPWQYANCVAPGLVIGSYARDSATVQNLASVGTPSNGSIVGNISYKINLLNSDPPSKTVHPTMTFSRTAGGISNQWAGLTVYKSFNSTTSSSFSYSTDPVVTSSHVSQVVYRTSSNGAIAIREQLTESNVAFFFKIYLWDGTTDTEFNVTAGLYTNRFVSDISSQAGGVAGTGSKFIDITQSGINYIEFLSQSATIQPPTSTPRSPDTLFQIERATASKRVTVFLLGFNFEPVSQTPVTVFPPNINQGETSNYGTVLAASYG